MNDLQQYALTVVMREDAEREREKEVMRFKMQAIALHPEHARKIMAIGNEEAQEELSEEELANYRPLQEQPDVKKRLISDLRNLGLAVIDE